VARTLVFAAHHSGIPLRQGCTPIIRGPGGEGIQWWGYFGEFGQKKSRHNGRLDLFLLLPHRSSTLFVPLTVRRAIVVVTGMSEPPLWMVGGVMCSGGAIKSVWDECVNKGN
jgi:hypothetical protein